MRVVDIEGLTARRETALPYSLRVVLENALRTGDGSADAGALVERVATWRPGDEPLLATLAVDRVVLPDSSGLPVILDFAALRDALVRRGCDPKIAEPVIPCDLIIDHSLIVEEYGHPLAAHNNLAVEFQRNAERYSVFKWAQQAFDKLTVVPPGMGIIHQIHLEYLAKVIINDGEFVHPEFVLGCDSHTPMVNALGVLGWGVGGIDAEAALIGERYRVHIPRVVGVRLSGILPAGVTTTDLVLTLTQRLRQTGVVGDFVEFTGKGLDGLSVPERATLANMAPEYGATCGYFPIDAQTLIYLRETGRDDVHVDRVETAARKLCLFRESEMEEPEFSALIDLDLSTVEPSVAGPKRPQDRIALRDVKTVFQATVSAPVSSGGFDAGPDRDHGVLAIAAITSCTNTSNPGLMLGAGVLARNAHVKGLRVPAHVKTSLAPGSRVVAAYLEAACLMPPLEALGFHIVGFGCTTCSGKSGPIDTELERKARDEGLIVASVLSGNRNFEGRIHKSVRANFITSPMLVVAFALAGHIGVDFETDPLGVDERNEPVFLRDIWPSRGEIEDLIGGAIDPHAYTRNYATIHDGTPAWHALPAGDGVTLSWDKASTYIKRPPFFDDDFIAGRTDRPDRLKDARVLAMFGDSLTTDHITPSGEIAPDTLAGRYLAGNGVLAADFNAYTQRRGNHEVLVRATFANPRIRNRLANGQEGGFTRHFPGGEIVPIYDAAARYRRDNIPIIVLAGHDYGMGSSRDWAAKGPALLGVSMVIAESFERIHRANLLGVGILPAQFMNRENAGQLGLDGSERFSFSGLNSAVGRGTEIQVLAAHPTGRKTRFCITAVLFGDDERKLMASGGIFPRLLENLCDTQTQSEPV